MANAKSHTPAILKKYGNELLAVWINELTNGLQNDRRISESELSSQTREFRTLIQTATASDGIDRVESASWAPVLDFLDSISRSRAQQGFSSGETAAFVLSFKKPLFERLRKELGKNAQALADETWSVTELLDKLGLHTVKAFQKAREAVISR
jgi:rsbT co-antagonist protein RsbR